jgi:hypothetical protein
LNVTAENPGTARPARQSTALPAPVIVVPTRNRADLAEGAIASVLEWRTAPVRILVSDNSTIPEERERLAAYCAAARDDRLLYVRPPEPMPMPPHWQWALERALELEASHYIYLTDRMLFKPGGLAELLDIGARCPEAVVAYNHDMVDDYADPVRLHLQQWSGRPWEVASADVVDLCSRSIFGNYIPRMLNCLVPRVALERIAGRFSTIFDSISPDFCFAFRFLATSESFVYYDRSILTHRGLDRSNGAAYSRGVESADSMDFGADLGRAQRHSATPVPELRGITNAILQEYCLVAAEAGGFPAVDRDLYLEAIAREVPQLQNPELRAWMEKALIRAGWRPAAQGGPIAVARHFGRRVARRAGPRIFGAAMSAPLWSLVARSKVPVPAPGVCSFPSAAEALGFAERYPRRPVPEPVELRPLLESPRTRPASPSDNGRV